LKEQVGKHLADFEEVLAQYLSGTPLSDWLSRPEARIASSNS
jgi:hypothetical protein